MKKYVYRHLQKQAAAVKKCIINATYQIRLRISSACLVFPTLTMGWVMPPKSEPNLIYGPWAHLSLHSNQQLDWFSHFWMAHDRDQQTDTEAAITATISHRQHFMLCIAMQSNNGYFSCKEELTSNSSSLYCPSSCLNKNYHL